MRLGYEPQWSVTCEIRQARRLKSAGRFQIHAGADLVRRSRRVKNER